MYATTQGAAALGAAAAWLAGSLALLSLLWPDPQLEERLHERRTLGFSGSARTTSRGNGMPSPGVARGAPTEGSTARTAPPLPSRGVGAGDRPLPLRRRRAQVGAPARTPRRPRP